MAGLRLWIPCYIWMTVPGIFTPRPLAAECYGFMRKKQGLQHPLLSAYIRPHFDGNFQGGPVGCFFWDSTGGSVTVRTHLLIDPCVWLVTGFEEKALSLKVDVGAGEWWFGSLSPKQGTLLLVLRELLPPQLTSPCSASGAGLSQQVWISLF